MKETTEKKVRTGPPDSPEATSVKAYFAKETNPPLEGLGFGEHRPVRPHTPAMMHAAAKRLGKKIVTRKIGDYVLFWEKK